MRKRRFGVCSGGTHAETQNAGDPIGNRPHPTTVYPLLIRCLDAQIHHDRPVAL